MLAILRSSLLSGCAALCWSPRVIAQDVQFMDSHGRRPQPLLTLQGLVVGGLAAGDYNHDGRTDLLAAGLFRLEVQTALASGGFSSQQLQSSLSPLHLPELRDLDNDGWPEVLFRPLPGGSGETLIVLHNVSGTFVPVNLSSVPSLRDVVFDDVDGDGDLDMVCVPGVFAPGNGVFLLRNSGSLQYAVDPSAMPAGLPSCQSLALGDFDNDGDRDILAVQGSIAAPTGPLLLLRNGGGTFTDISATLPAIRTGQTCAAAADFDGDGNLDVALGRADADLDMLWSTGTGFAAQTAVAAPGPIHSLFPFDADLDGRADLGWAHTFISEVTLSTIGVLRAAPGRTFVPALTVPSYAFGYAFVDFDGDGVTDVLYADSANNVHLRYRAGLALDDAAYTSWYELPPAAFELAPPLAGDVDGDGRTDLVQQTALGITVQHGLGDNRFLATRSPVTTTTSVTTVQSRLADLDNDGDLDLVVATPANVRGYANDGSGTFSLLFDRAVASAGLDTMRVSDLDGDGDLDIVRAGGASVTMIRNLGGGQFSAPLIIASGSNLPVPALEVADLDGNGTPEIITRFQAAGGGHLVLTANGAGGFTASTMSVDLGAQATTIRAGDFDRDGDLDLAIVTGTRLGLRSNNGFGVFTDSTATSGIPTPPSISGNLVVADLDGDGDLDVLGSYAPPSLRRMLLDNNGSGRFVDVGATRFRDSSAVSPSAWELEVADIDDDGDLDVATHTDQSGSPFTAILTNHLRQLTSRNTPRLGRTAEIAIHTGPGFGPSGVGVLFAGNRALAPTHQPFVPGAIQLDPASLVQIDALSTSGFGSSVSFQHIQNSAALLGVELSLQAVTLDTSTGAPGMTNALFERILPQ